MRPGEAIIELSRMGFKFEVADGKVRYRYEGPVEPDPSQAVPLLEVVKAHRDEVAFFLKCHCPRCGGVVFGTFEGKSHCLACYWESQKTRKQDLGRTELRKTA
jgi:hypothetical protein